MSRSLADDVPWRPAYTTNDADTIDPTLGRCGFLMRKGEHLGRWKRRWYMVRYGAPSLLFYFVDQPERLSHAFQVAPKGVVLLTGAYIEVWPAPRKATGRFGWTIHYPDNGRYAQYDLCAATARERDEWLESLYAACSPHQAVGPAAPDDTRAAVAAEASASALASASVTLHGSAGGRDNREAHQSETVDGLGDGPSSSSSSSSSSLLATPQDGGARARSATAAADDDFDAAALLPSLDMDKATMFRSLGDVRSHLEHVKSIRDRVHRVQANQQRALQRQQQQLVQGEARRRQQQQDVLAVQARIRQVKLDDQYLHQDLGMRLVADAFALHDRVTLAQPQALMRQYRQGAGVQPDADQILMWSLREIHRVRDAVRDWAQQHFDQQRHRHHHHLHERPASKHGHGHSSRGASANQDEDAFVSVMMDVAAEQAEAAAAARRGLDDAGSDGAFPSPSSSSDATALPTAPPTTLASSLLASASASSASSAGTSNALRQTLARLLTSTVELSETNNAKQLVILALTRDKITMFEHSLGRRLRPKGAVYPGDGDGDSRSASPTTLEAMVDAEVRSRRSQSTYATL